MCTILYSTENSLDGYIHLIYIYIRMLVLT